MITLVCTICTNKTYVYNCTYMYCTRINVDPRITILFWLFLHDWNHAWKIHQIFSNTSTSNNLLKISLWWPEVISCIFFIFGVFLFHYLVHCLHVVVYHSIIHGKQRWDEFVWTSYQNNIVNNHDGFRSQRISQHTVKQY